MLGQGAACRGLDLSQGLLWLGECSCIFLSELYGSFYELGALLFRVDISLIFGHASTWKAK